MIIYVDYKRLKGIAIECIADIVTWNPRFVEKYGIGRMRVHIVTENKNDLSKYHELNVDIKNFFYLGNNILFLETI